MEVTVPAKGKDRDMMVPVEEDKRLLVDNNEDRVDEFPVMGKARW